MEKIERTYFEEIKERFIRNARKTNGAAKEKDIKRNRTNFGAFIAWMKVLQDMGHEVKIAAIEERGFVKIFTISIDGEKTSFAVKKTGGTPPEP